MPSLLKDSVTENCNDDDVQNLKTKKKRYFTPSGPYEFKHTPGHASPIIDAKVPHTRTDSLNHINASHINISSHDFVVTGTAATTSKHDVRLTGSSLISTRCTPKQLSTESTFGLHLDIHIPSFLNQTSHGRLSPMVKPESLPHVIPHNYSSPKSSAECDLNVTGFSLSHDKLSPVEQLQKSNLKKTSVSTKLLRRGTHTGLSGRTVPFMGFRSHHPLPVPGGKRSPEKGSSEKCGLSISKMLDHISNGNFISSYKHAPLLPPQARLAKAGHFSTGLLIARKQTADGKTQSLSLGRVSRVDELSRDRLSNARNPKLFNHGAPRLVAQLARSTTNRRQEGPRPPSCLRPAPPATNLRAVLG